MGLSRKFITLLAFQGFSVALFFCFFNSEVRQACRHRFNLWRDSRNLRGNSIRSRRNMSKEYRSRTESVRWTFVVILSFRFWFIFALLLDWPFPLLKVQWQSLHALILISFSINPKNCVTDPHNWINHDFSQTTAFQSDYTRSYQNDRNVRTPMRMPEIRTIIIYDIRDYSIVENSNRNVSKAFYRENNREHFLSFVYFWSGIIKYVKIYVENVVQYLTEEKCMLEINMFMPFSVF
jgi:hypothetical protein